MKFLTRLIFFITLTLTAPLVYAQQPLQVAPQAGDTTTFINIIFAERNTFRKLDSVTNINSLAGQVHLIQDKTQFYADSAIINFRTKIAEAFGRVHINDSDTLHTYAKYFKYFGADKKVILRNAVKLTDNKGGSLTTEELLYDLNTKIGTYNKGGTVVNKSSVLTSKEGEYYGETNDVVFRKNVILNDPKYKIFTDSLLYNTGTEVARFIAPTTILSGKQKIYTKEGYYDLKTGKAYFGSRTTMIDSGMSLTADRIAIDDKAGLMQAEGRAILVDSINHVVVMGGKIFGNNKKSTFLGTEKPLMILTQDKDSVYITADTLYSGRLTDLNQSREVPIVTDTIKNRVVFDLQGKDSSQNRFFEAWHHVRIFSDSVQAVCDSLFYAGTDSTFRLYRDPIVWSGENQLTADTIYLFTQNKKPEHMYAFYNGFMLSRVEGDYFHQAKGNTINAWFKEGNIDYTRIKGKAESVYYNTDEAGRFIGGNKTISDAIDMYFKEKKPVKVVFLNDLKGTLYPMRQLPADVKRLKDFNWQESKRPKTKFELF